MRRLITLPALILALLFATLVPASAESGLHTFYGEVVAIDTAKKVLQLKSGNQRFLFHYNDQTRITSTGATGRVRLDRILRGTGAAVVMRVGEGNAGIALQIRFVPGATRDKTLRLISARTVRGETVTGIAVSNFVDYQPPSDAWAGGPSFEARNPGLFVASVAPDGTVSNVTLRVSTGYPELDARALKWMKKWRFRPNTFTEVQLPMYYYSYRRR